MANLSSLVHELRERIASSASTPPNKQRDEVLESRFRAVLPSLLQTYVVPSSSGNFCIFAHCIVGNFEWLGFYIVSLLKKTTECIVAKEREVIAVLKLLSHTAKNFPGVFYHGQASAVIPVIGRILPFFAEPTFR